MVSAARIAVIAAGRGTLTMPTSGKVKVLRAGARTGGAASEGSK